MKVSFSKIQEAFIRQDITLEQFIEILIDNFGRKKTEKILMTNLQIALATEAKKEGLAPQP